MRASAIKKEGDCRDRDRSMGRGRSSPATSAQLADTTYLDAPIFSTSTPVEAK